tara:strand:- start:612 stop:1607 length:996 start_codon:yes stop_codon:yes gene_type:complete
MGKYQNVGVPKFYIDYFQYAFTTGLITIDDVSNDGEQNNQDFKNLFYLNPTKTTAINELTFEINTKIQTDLNTFNYFMVLNHDLHDSGENFAFGTRSLDEQAWAGFAYDENVNSCAVAGGALYNGWSLMDLTWVPSDNNSQEVVLFPVLSPCNIGAISIGTSYTMPHSPDLDLTMTREFGNVTKQFTKGGALLTNYNYTQPPVWGRGEPWGLYTEPLSNLENRRAGRRVWDLKFSYVSDSDIMAEIEMLNLHPNDENNDSIEYEERYSQNAFFPTFMQRTLGGSLRFVFQPDSNDNNCDGFAICVLDQDSISIKQITYNTYNINLRIMEVW